MNMVFPASLALLPPLMAVVLEGLCRAIGVWGGRERGSVAVVWAAYTRVRRTLQRFSALVARVADGRRRSAHTGTWVQASRAGQPGVRPAGPSVPRRVGWLAFRVWEARAMGSQLEHLLATPEMVAFLTVAPDGWRILGPVCRMLGVAVPEAAKRRRPRVVAPGDVDAPAPAAASGRPAGDAAANGGAAAKGEAAIAWEWRDPGWVAP